MIVIRARKPDSVILALAILGLAASAAAVSSCSSSGGGFPLPDGGGGHDAHDTDGAIGSSCWTPADCTGGTFCHPPGQPLCGGACLAVQEPCATDSDCGPRDGGGPAICAAMPCACGPTGNLGCQPGCTADQDCPVDQACGADHHCAPVGCGVSCPVDFACGAEARCQRKTCTSDAQCSAACVGGVCYASPGTCQFAVP